MIVGIEERSVVIEAVVTLAYMKADLWNFVLGPAGIPEETYGILNSRRNPIDGRRLSKRQLAPLILSALEERDDYVKIVGKIIEIAANWEHLELSHDQF